MQPFTIDPQIHRAQTLPAEVYASPAWFAVQKERVFARSWQMVRGAERVKAPGHLLPFTMLEGTLDEPLVLAAGDDGVLRCLSNVCTHRGTVVCEGETHAKHLRCRYHGRRFALDGRFLSMPEFNEADVAFMQMMVPHHAQAIVMAELAENFHGALCVHHLGRGNAGEVELHGKRFGFHCSCHQRPMNNGNEAMRWLRRAAESAGEAGDDVRALSLSRVVADLHQGAAEGARELFAYRGIE